MNRELVIYGMELQLLQDKRITASQESKIKGLTNSTEQPSFTSARDLAQYIGACRRPKVCAGVQLLTLGTDPTTRAKFGS